MTSNPRIEGTSRLRRSALHAVMRFRISYTWIKLWTGGHLYVST